MQLDEFPRLFEDDKMNVDNRCVSMDSVPNVGRANDRQRG